VLGTIAYAFVATGVLGVLVYLLSRRRLPAWAAWPLGLAFCWGVELWQLTGIPARLSSQWIGWRLSLGTTFDWVDVALYPVGVALAAVVLLLCHRVLPLHAPRPDAVALLALQACLAAAAGVVATVSVLLRSSEWTRLAAGERTPLYAPGFVDWIARWSSVALWGCVLVLVLGLVTAGARLWRGRGTARVVSGSDQADARSSALHSPGILLAGVALALPLALSAWPLAVQARAEFPLLEAELPPTPAPTATPVPSAQVPLVVDQQPEPTPALTTTVPRGSATAPACAPDDVEFVARWTDALHGNPLGLLTSRNTSDAACVLSGRPALRVEQGGRTLDLTIAAPEVFVRDAPAKDITLAPGGVAVSTLAWRGYGALDHESQVPQRLLLTLHDSEAEAALVPLPTGSGASSPAPTSGTTPSRPAVQIPPTDLTGHPLPSATDSAAAPATPTAPSASAGPASGQLHLFDLIDGGTLGATRWAADIAPDQ